MAIRKDVSVLAGVRNIRTIWWFVLFFWKIITTREQDYHNSDLINDHQPGPKIVLVRILASLSSKHDFIPSSCKFQWWMDEWIFHGISMINLNRNIWFIEFIHVFLFFLVEIFMTWQTKFELKSYYILFFLKIWKICFLFSFCLVNT